MKLNALAVGGTTGTGPSCLPFCSSTGRNQPSNTKFMFGPSVWLRTIIKPRSGKALAYVDWSQQEFGIAAALSGDALMQKAYSSGDPYLEFAKQAGAVPASATEESHGTVRERFKACVLAVQCGMGAEALAERIGQSPAHARELLRLHKETYAGFWRSSDAALDHAMLTGKLKTVFGWTVQVGTDPNRRSLLNFPMQANGAEMLRLACILGVEAGIESVRRFTMPSSLKRRVTPSPNRSTSSKSSWPRRARLCLPAFSFGRSEVIPSPERYMDPRGAVMWERVESYSRDQTPDTFSTSICTPSRPPRQPPSRESQSFKRPWQATC